VKDLALIHGWGMGSAAWEPVLPLLAQHFHLHLIALPGYDASLGNDDDDFVHAAQALVERLPEKCLLAGWSLGAMLALQIASLAPQGIERLILISATPSFVQRPDWSEAQPPALLEAFSDAVSKDASGTLQRFIALMNQGDLAARAIARALTRRVLAAPLADTATLLAGLTWLRTVDLRQMVGKVEMPALLIHGAKDSLMSLSAARWLQASLPCAQLEVFDGAAHAPFLNDPQRFVRLIGGFSHA